MARRHGARKQRKQKDGEREVKIYKNSCQRRWKKCLKIVFKIIFFSDMVLGVRFSEVKKNLYYLFLQILA